MTKLHASAALIFATLLACDDRPAWVRSKIDSLQRLPEAPAGDTSFYMARFRYQGRTVYYISPHCCDIGSVLLDARGNELCSPDGAFAGRGDGRCPDFIASRSNGKILWRSAPR